MLGAFHELLAFSSILGYAAYLTAKKPKLSPFAPMIVIASIVPVLFLFGLLGIINETAMFIKVVGTGLLVWQILRYNQNPHFTRKAFGLYRGVFFFGVVGFLWFLRCRGGAVYGWDEFFWVCLSKVVNSTSEYWNSKSPVLTSIQIRYLPGFSLWQSFFMGQGRYSEPALFFAMGLIGMSCWSALILMVKNLRPRVLIGFFSVFLFALFGPGISSLLVDQFVGAFFGLTLVYCFYLNRRRLSFMWMLPVLVCLTCFKEMALILVGIVLLVQFALIIQSLTLKKCLQYLILIVCALAPVKIWNYQLAKDPDIQTNTASFNLQETIDAMVLQKTENNQKIGAAFRKGIFTKKIFPVNADVEPFRGFDSLFAIVLFILCMVFYCLRRLGRTKVNASLFVASLIAGIFIYSMALLYFWTVVVVPFEGLQLMSYSRYYSSLIFGLLLFCLFLTSQILEGVPVISRRWKVAIGAFAAFSLIEPANWAGTLKSPKNMSKQSADVRQRVRVVVDMVNQVAPKDAKIWFLNQASTGIELLVFRYEIAPRIVNSSVHSLGKRYYPTDIWTNDLPPANFKSYAQPFSYLAVANGDDQLRGVLSAVDPTLKDAKFPGVFKFERNGDELKIVQVQP